MDWNLYYPRARFPFLDPHLSWPRLSYFSCQPFPPQVHQDPFQASYQASLHPHHHFGNESKIIIPTSPSPHYSPHPLLHQQNFAYAPVDTSRLTIDVTTSRFIPSLPSGHVVHPIESELLACQAPVNLSSQGTTHLQTLHNAIPPATATSSFLTSSSHYQLCDPSLSNINSTSSYGLPSPCHINNNNSMPTYSPRVDTLSVPLITLTPKVIQPQESVRVPIDQKPNVSDDALLTSTIVEAVTLSDSTSEVKEEIKLIKKEVLEVESSESKENEDCTKSNPVSSVEEVKIPSSSTKSEKTKTEKAKDGSVKIPTTDLKQLKFLSSKNVNKSASKSCCIKPTIVPVTSDSELSQSTKTKNVIEKSSSILTCEQSKVGKEKKVAGSKVGKIKVPTRTIEVQCDGPDWTPVVLRTQVKNRLLKIKKKDDKDKQHGNSDGGKLKESKKKVEKFSPSPTSLEDDKKTKKSKQEPPKQEEGNEEKRNDDERNKKKTKNGNKTKKLSSKSSSSKSLEHETSQYPEQVESDPSSLPASTSCLKLKASSSTTTSTETMTQITPKRKIVGDGTGESGSKKKKVKKERSDISDQAKKSKKEQGPKSCELKNAVKRAAGKNVEKKKKDEDGSKKKKSKETKKQKLLHGSTIECINKKSIIIPVDQIKFLKPAPALTLNNVEKEQGVKIEVSGDGRKDTSQPLPPPPPLQLIKPSSPASKNNKLTKEKGKENSKKSKSPSLKKDDSSMSSISPFKIPSPNVRQRKIKSGLDMIRNRKKKVVKMVQMQQQQPSNSPKVNSPEVHQQQQSSVTKRLSVNRAIGETVLHRASRLGYKDIVISVLSNCDIDAIDARDNAGYTPLHECSARGHFDIAQLLLSHGADVNASAAGGIKPLHDAVEGDHVQLVRLLLSYGADPTISTYAGETAFNLSKSRSMTEFIRGEPDIYA